MMVATQCGRERAHLKRIWRAGVLVVPLALLSGAVALAGQAEFCVTCQGPDATYRCAFDGDSAMPGRPGLQLHCISTLAREGGHQSCSIGRANKAPCAGALKVLALPGSSPGAVQSDPVQADGPAPPAPAAAQTTAVEPPQADVEMQGVRHSPAAPMPSPPATAKRTWNDTSGPSSGETAQAPPAPAEDVQAAKPVDEDADGDAQSSGLMKPLDGAGKAVSDAAKTTGEALGKAGDAVGSAAKKSWKCLTSLFGDC